MTKNHVCGLILLTVLLAPAAWASGGFFVFTGEVNDNTEQAILPAGTLDTTLSLKNGVSIQVGLRRSGGASRLFTQSLQYGGTTSFDLEELRFELEADGSFTVRRLGTQTYSSVVVRGIWIS